MGENVVREIKIFGNFRTRDKKTGYLKFDSLPHNYITLSSSTARIVQCLTYSFNNVVDSELFVNANMSLLDRDMMRVKHNKKKKKFFKKKFHIYLCHKPILTIRSSVFKNKIAMKKPTRSHKLFVIQ